MAKKKSRGFKCGICGRIHTGLPTEWAFVEPDAILGLPYVVKYLRVRNNADLCTLDESRYFLRCHLALPFVDGSGNFGWGIWVEVSQDDHNVYAVQIMDEAEGTPAKQIRLAGTIANAIPGYRKTLGVAVDLVTGEPRQRPAVWFLGRSRHSLAREQAGGISSARHHELLEALGYFESPVNNAAR